MFTEAHFAFIAAVKSALQHRHRQLHLSQAAFFLVQTDVTKRSVFKDKNSSLQAEGHKRHNIYPKTLTLGVTFIVEKE